ncbi:MAG: arylsulfatase A-like enzyme [Planctomycetota bacterium]|jgi:arylsulfatase A-like enzyme
MNKQDPPIPPLLPMTPASSIRPSCVLFASLFALTVGCGGDSSGAGEQGRLTSDHRADWAGRQFPAVRGLELAPVNEWSAPTEARVERRILVPEDLAEWSVTANEHEVRDLTDMPEPRELALRGPGKRKIEIPGPFDPRTFNRLVLQVGSLKPDMVTVAFKRDDRPALNPLPVIVSKGARVELGFDLEDMGASKAPFDSLIIRFTGKVPENRLLSVDLVERQVAACLPCAGEYDWISLGTDARPATMLFSEQPLSTKFRVSKEGGQLEYAIGLPELVRYSQVPSAIVVTLYDGTSKHTQQTPVRGAGKAQWSPVRISLDGYKGKEVSATFELKGKKDMPVVCALAQPEVVRPIENPPTVLFITSDTHRRDHTGVDNSGVEVDTPTIDALAARGVYFENATSTTNITLPSHTAMFTGTHPRDTGIFDNMDLLADKAQTLAECYQDAGWTSVAAVSAVWLTPTRSGLGQGFQRYGFDHQAQRDSQKAIADVRRWLPELSGRPLFVWLHIFDAHTPYTPPPDFAQRFYPKEKNPRDPDLPEPRKILIPSSMPGIKDPDYIGSMYRAEVAYLDTQLGGMIEHKRFDNAIIALTADHGELLGDHGSWWNHGALAPGTLDVPLILAWPGGQEGVRIERQVQNHDIGRTLLDLSGYQEMDFPGQNLLALGELPQLSGEPVYSIAVLFDSASVQRDGWFLQAMFDDRFGADKAPKGRPRTLHLFELASDPQCLKDRIGDEADLASELEELLFDYLAAANDQGWDAPDSIRDPTTQMHLRALGYANDNEDEDE